MKIPSIEMNGQTYPLASVTGIVGVTTDGQSISIGSSLAQVSVKFKLLGICAFANEQTERLGPAELQKAVDSILN